jgi:hypothetical protein
MQEADVPQQRNVRTSQFHNKYIAQLPSEQ